MLRILAVFLVLAGTALAQRVEQCTQISFGGDLEAGDKFSQEIGSGLIFRIEPWADEAGWQFEIGPTESKAGDVDNYIGLLTPPYRDSNATQVNTGWGVTAQDAVKRPREFKFLLSEKQAPKAEAVLDQVLWPSSHHAMEKALDILAGFPYGTGEFKVLDSKITPGTPVPGYSNCEAGHCGQIQWIKFEVHLIVPQSFRPDTRLQTERVACPKSKPGL
ncbi:MAG TPA: hypothetical protein VFQ00_08280 [Terriglobales bacterium]|nr:hypothetical protein [Terriglobales bacterium]